MWEESGMAPPQAGGGRKKGRGKPKTEENLVLWAQVLLCLAAVGLVLGARYMQWPVLKQPCSRNRNCS